MDQREGVDDVMVMSVRWVGCVISVCMTISVGGMEVV